MHTCFDKWASCPEPKAIGVRAGILSIRLSLIVFELDSFSVDSGLDWLVGKSTLVSETTFEASSFRKLGVSKQPGCLSHMLSVIWVDKLPMNKTVVWLNTNLIHIWDLIIDKHYLPSSSLHWCLFFSETDMSHWLSLLFGSGIFESKGLLGAFWEMQTKLLKWEKSIYIPAVLYPVTLENSQGGSIILPLAPSFDLASRYTEVRTFTKDDSGSLSRFKSMTSLKTESIMASLSEGFDFNAN